MENDCIVVLRDHDGDWHAVAGPAAWDIAVAQFSAVIGVLSTIDYYTNYSPECVKIIRNGEDYATAVALAENPYSLRRSAASSRRKRTDDLLDDITGMTADERGWIG